MSEIQRISNRTLSSLLEDDAFLNEIVEASAAWTEPVLGDAPRLPGAAQTALMASPTPMHDLNDDEDLNDQDALLEIALRGTVSQNRRRSRQAAGAVDEFQGVVARRTRAEGSTDPLSGHYSFESVWRNFDPARNLNDSTPSNDNRPLARSYAQAIRRHINPSTSSLSSNTLTQPRDQQVYVLSCSAKGCHTILCYRGQAPPPRPYGSLRSKSHWKFDVYSTDAAPTENLAPLESATFQPNPAFSPPNCQCRGVLTACKTCGTVAGFHYATFCAFCKDAASTVPAHQKPHAFFFHVAGVTSVPRLDSNGLFILWDKKMPSLLTDFDNCLVGEPANWLFPSNTKCSVNVPLPSWMPYRCEGTLSTISSASPEQLEAREETMMLYPFTRRRQRSPSADTEDLSPEEREWEARQEQISRRVRRRVERTAEVTESSVELQSAPTSADGVDYSCSINDRVSYGILSRDHIVPSSLFSTRPDRHRHASDLAECATDPFIIANVEASSSREINILATLLADPKLSSSLYHFHVVICIQIVSVLYCIDAPSRMTRTSTNIYRLCVVFFHASEFTTCLSHCLKDGRSRKNCDCASRQIQPERIFETYFKVSHNQYDSKSYLPENPSELPQNPITLFQKWFNMAIDAKVPEPEAVALSTVSLSPIPTPSTRFVLMKRVDDRGLVWFTNYESRKAQEIAAQPTASMAFYWKELSVSVRFVGDVEKVPPAESLDYFLSRPLGSRVGAWASPQSQSIPNRQALDDEVAKVEDKFKVQRGSAERDALPEDGSKVQELPPHWGGFRLIPREVEFWAGRKNRLHDRYRYLKSADGEWQIDRLAP